MIMDNRAGQIMQIDRLGRAGGHVTWSNLELRFKGQIKREYLWAIAASSVDVVEGAVR